MNKIRLLVADDHASVRDGFCRLLDDEEDFEVVGKSSDGEEAVVLAEQLKPDVVMIDVSMPSLNGIEAAKRIKQSCPETAILMVSAYNYEYFVLDSLQAGAAGYLLKDVPFAEMVSAIRMVRLGKAVFDLQVAGDLLYRLGRGSSRSRHNRAELHGRELEILKLAAKGISNKEIAVQLVISERTVETHLVNIFRKLGVDSRTKAVLKALKKGWVTLNDFP